MDLNTAPRSELVALIYELTDRVELLEGEIVELLHAAAKTGKPYYQNLLSQIRGSPMINADETGGRQNGINGYFWSLSTSKAHVLLYRKSRSSQAVEEVVGKDSQEFKGVLVSDFYAAYNTCLGFHQRCWIHFLRDIHELKKRNPRHPPL